MIISEVAAPMDIQRFGLTTAPASRDIFSGEIQAHESDKLMKHDKLSGAYVYAVYIVSTAEKELVSMPRHTVEGVLTIPKELILSSASLPPSKTPHPSSLSSRRSLHSDSHPTRVSLTTHSEIRKSLNDDDDGSARNIIYRPAAK